MIIDARPRHLDEITVARVLPDRHRRNVGPFVFLDHMGPTTGTFDVRPHPHIGLATVTYLFEGTELHRDSLGSVQTIAPGEINLMQAGAGICHSERGPHDGPHALHGLQLWVALPQGDGPGCEDGPARFEHVPADANPRFTDGRATGHVLLGSVFGATAPAHDSSGAVFADIELPAGASIRVPGDIAEAALYVVSGRVTGAHAQQLIVREGDPLEVTAEEPSRLALIGGRPLDAPRVLDWNYVASSRERIDRAKAAWLAQDRSGRFGLVPGDSVEFTPYPSLAPTS
ncbi:MAG TPA: pirin family protein [Kofleriaceae bacterium]|jgi:hypothetical protein